MSGIHLMYLGGVQKQTYWIGTIGDNDTNYTLDIFADGSGNSYMCGYSNVSSVPQTLLVKYDSTGVLQWQKKLSGSSLYDQFTDLVLDSSGNIYAVGYTYQSTTHGYLVKYDNSGTVSWQIYFSDTTSEAIGQGLTVDSSGNVYVSGYFNPGGTDAQQIYLSKYDSSGTLQWQRKLNRAGIDVGQELGIDSSNNIYICGYTADGGNNNNMLLAKYDDTGAIQWQRKLSGAGTADDVATGVAVDSSNDIYMVGYSNNSGTYDIQIAKYNSSGTIQWQRRLGGTGTQIGVQASTDSSNNVYVVGYDDSGGTYDFVIAKYDSSGTIQWQRKIYSSSGSDIGRGVFVDSTGTLYVCGDTDAAGNVDGLFAKLPSDGSLTGTYTVGGYSFTYATASFTDASTSLTDAASGLTDAANNFTTTSISRTAANSSLTSNVTQI